MWITSMDGASYWKDGDDQLSNIRMHLCRFIRDRRVVLRSRNGDRRRDEAVSSLVRGAMEQL